MNYLYEAVDETGLPVFGKIDAKNEREAERQLQQRGLRPQSLAPSAAGGREQATYQSPLGPAASEGSNNSPNATMTLTPVDPLYQTQVMQAQPSGTSSHRTPSAPSVMDRVASPLMQELTDIGTKAALPRVVSMPVSSTSSAPAIQQTNRVGNITLSGNAARVQSKVTQTRAVPSHLQHAAAKGPDVSTLGNVKTRDMLFFFRQFSSLTHSGITLYGALENLGIRTPNANLAQTAREMSEVARDGGLISDVMARYPRIYPEHVTGLMRAGETGGFLDIALTEIADNYDANIKLYRAAWIPKTMALQAFIMLPIVLPLFPFLFRSFDWQANLKGYFLFELFVSLPISIGLFALVMLAGRRLQLPQYRYLRDSWSLKFPAFGNLQREVAIRTFLRMLSRLYHAGIMPIQAWQGAMNTASNVVIRDQLGRSYELIQSGSTLADAFSATGLFANQVEQMVFTGQQSGQVVEMLDQATAYYEERAEEAAGKARFMMFRLGLIGMLVFGGISLLWLVHTYFGGIFHIVDAEMGQ